jgi:hypothetical protein
MFWPRLLLVRINVSKQSVTTRMEWEFGSAVSRDRDLDQLCPLRQFLPYSWQHGKRPVIFPIRPAGMSLFGNWNATFLPEFKGTPLAELFRDRIEPFVAAVRAQLIATGEWPAGP